MVLGITAETNSFSPLTVAGDFAYGSVKMGEIPGYEGFADGPGTFKLDRALVCRRARGLRP